VIRANPAISDSEAARAVGTGASHKTVGGVRRRLEEAGEIPVMPRRGQRDEARRAKIAGILRADPATSDGAASRAAGTDKNTAWRVRRELEAAGEIPVLRRKGRGKPVPVHPEGTSERP
jgi:hypothetical protein